MKKALLKVVAILANLLMLGAVIFLWITEGPPKGENGIIWILIAAWTVAPILSLIVIIPHLGDDSWFSLYLKRKALEEKQKIRRLELDN